MTEINAGQGVNQAIKSNRLFAFQGVCRWHGAVLLYFAKAFLAVSRETRLINLLSRWKTSRSFSEHPCAWVRWRGTLGTSMTVQVFLPFHSIRTLLHAQYLSSKHITHTKTPRIRSPTFPRWNCGRGKFVGKFPKGKKLSQFRAGIDNDLIDQKIQRVSTETKSQSTKIHASANLQLQQISRLPRCCRDASINSRESSSQSS